MPFDWERDVAAVIVAAGKSSRMGQCKALLTLNGSTFIETIAKAIYDAGIEKLFVTIFPPLEKGAGGFSSAASPTNPPTPFSKGGKKSAHFVTNIFMQRELLGSVQSVLSLGPCYRALLIFPVDMPFVTTELIGRFKENLESTNTSPAIVRTLCLGEPAHPLLITHHFFEEVLALGDCDSLRTFIARNEHRILNIHSEDKRLLLNINTPQDYERCTKPSLNIFDAAPTDAPGVKSL